MTFEDFREDPLELGVSVSLDEAGTMSPIPISLPAHEIANESSIDRVWITDPGSPLPQVAITFDSGLVIVEERPQFPDARSEFEGLVKFSLDGVDARVADIDGMAALVIEPDGDADGETPGSVQLVVGDVSPKESDGVSVTIYGGGASGAELMEILSTLSAPS